MYIYVNSVKVLPHLEEEAETDPLIILDVTPFFGIYCLVDSWMSDINPYSLPKSAGNCVSGMNPTVGVEHIFRYVLGVNAVNGITHILSGRYNERER